MNGTIVKSASFVLKEHRKEVERVRASLRKEDFAKYKGESEINKNLRLASKMKDPVQRQFYMDVAQMLMDAKKAQREAEKRDQQIVGHDELVQITEQARFLGPTLGQRLKWLAQDASRFVNVMLHAVVIFGLYFVIISFFVAMICTSLYNIYKAITT